MSRAVLISIFYLLAVSCSFAQPSSTREAIRLGFIGDYAANRYTADFMNLPGCPTCSNPNFRDGRGDGFLAGIFIHLPLHPLAGIDFAITYSDFSGSLSVYDEETMPITRGSVIEMKTLLIRQTLNASIQTIGIEPQAYFYFYDAFRINAGMSLGYVVNGSLKQTKTIVDTSYYYFGTGNNTTTIYSGDIQEMRKILASLTFGVSYDFSFGFIHPYIITPEVSYSLGVMNIVRGIDWKIYALRAGLRISFPMGDARTQ